MKRPERRRYAADEAGLTKRELAVRYYPGCSEECAVRRLRDDIVRCRPLSEALTAMGYRSRLWRFTPAQVEAIYEHLGEP